jgi:hypothetical protein
LAAGLLSGLALVAWEKLGHAYGVATDIPDLLRAIAHGDSDIGDLFGNIVHQGTVYSATGPSVPFLVELLEHEAANNNDDNVTALLVLLGMIADGMGYDQVHQSLHPPTIAYPDDDNNDPVKDEPDDDDVQPEGTEHDWVTAAHNAVCAALPRFVPLLAHQDIDIRFSTVALLGRLSGCAATVMPLLLAHRDDDDTVRAMVIDAVSRLLVANADNQAWRLHPSTWIAPLSSQPLLRVDGLAHLQQAAASTTGIERLIAVDALTTDKSVVVVSAQTLAEDFVVAAEIIDSVEDWTHRRFFEGDPALSMAVITHRLQQPTVPDRVIYDAQEWIGSRRHRGAAVAMLSHALLHDNDEVAIHIASFMRTMGLALRDVVGLMHDAIARRPVLSALLVRPLRVLGDPLADRLLLDICRGHDDAALAFNAPLLRARDEDACGAVAMRLGELLVGDELRTPTATGVFAERSRTSESTLPITLHNVREALLRALVTAKAAPISLLVEATQAGMITAAEALCAHVDDPHIHALIMACTTDARFARHHDRLRRAISDDNDPAWEVFATSLRKKTNWLPWDELALVAKKPLGTRARQLIDDLLPRWRWLAQQTSPDWAVVSCQVGLWAITRDPSDILPGLHAQIVPKLSGHRALQLLLELGVPSQAVPPLLNQDDESAFTKIELDEAWLADLHRAALL